VMTADPVTVAEDTPSKISSERWRSVKSSGCR
jgi:hypothetical protein